MDIKKITDLAPELSLFHYNEIPVLKLEHPLLGSALISLQGAQLLQWQPKNQKQSVLWLSEIEPFQKGKAIRGGIPLCYPWFNNAGTPAHGYARISLWQLADYIIEENQIKLTFVLLDKNGIVEAKLKMQFDQNCTLTFSHYKNEGAQIAFHSYFNLENIDNVEVQQLPTQCQNFLTGQQESTSSHRYINENIDCLYQVPTFSQAQIKDKILNRIIHLQQQNASDMVLWNPWHKETSSMTPTAYQQMLCLESARIQHLLPAKQEMSLTLSAISY